VPEPLDGREPDVPLLPAPVPEEQDYWDEDDCDDSESEYEYEEDGSSPVPDGSSSQEVTASPPSSTWSRTSVFELLIMFVCVGLFTMN
jgi:hypothetical protein